MHRTQPSWEVHVWSEGAVPGSHSCLFLASGFSCLLPQGRPLPLRSGPPLTSRILNRKVGLQEPQHCLPGLTLQSRLRSQTKERGRNILISPGKAIPQWGCREVVCKMPAVHQGSELVIRAAPPLPMPDTVACTLKVTFCPSRQQSLTSQDGVIPAM